MKKLKFTSTALISLTAFVLASGVIPRNFASADTSPADQAQDGVTPAAPAAPSGSGDQSKSAATDSDCSDDYDNAVKACTTANTTAGQTGQQQQAAQQQQQQAQQANQNVAQSGANQAMQCLNQANLGQALAGLSAGKGQQCSAMISQCKDSCSAVAKQYKDGSGGKTQDSSKAKKFQKKSDTCDSLSPNAGAAMAQAAGLLTGMLAALACAEQNATASPTPVAVADCTNPTYAATSILCLCASDPKNAMCTAQQQFPAGANTSTGDMGPATPGTGTTDLSTDGAIAGTDQAKPDSARGSAATGDGGGGGPQAGGKNGLNPSGDDGGGAGRSTVEKGVITGTMASSGGGAASGGAVGGGGGGSGRGGGGKNAAGGFDLSKYLPKAATRGIAGMSISAKDGVTGPLGPSIWEKVSNQYQLQKPNMIQDH